MSESERRRRRITSSQLPFTFVIPYSSYLAKWMGHICPENLSFVLDWFIKVVLSNNEYKNCLLGSLTRGEKVRIGKVKGEIAQGQVVNTLIATAYYLSSSHDGVFTLACSRRAKE